MLKGSLALRLLLQYRPHNLALMAPNTPDWAVSANVSSELETLEFAAVLIPEPRRGRR
jgi:hypothetical protein